VSLAELRVGSLPASLRSPIWRFSRIDYRCQRSQIKTLITLASTKTKKISVEVIAPLTGRLAQQIKTLTTWDKGLQTATCRAHKG
jgi:hypothetical protein